MIWTLPDLLHASGGELVRWGHGPFLGVSTDSRTTEAGEVFLALAGPRHDGHEFVAPAIGRGATGIVVSRDSPRPTEDVAWVRVDDTLRALGDLAFVRRSRLRARIVAITGSNGKTTTKEMIAAILTASGAVVGWSRGNENNLVGLPQTILRLSGKEDYAVLEMGMNHPGEIWRLAEIACPDVGVITNVGPAHLEGLGSLSAIAAAKGELPLALSARSMLVVNGEDPHLAVIADAFPGRTLRAGADGPVRPTAVDPSDDGMRVSLEIEGRTVRVRLQCVGAHNVSNAVIAATTAVALDVDPNAIAAGLETFSPPSMRLEVMRLRSGARVWNDAYNANPASMAAALESLAAEKMRRTNAVLGEMWELGAEAERYHRETGRKAAEAGLDLFVAVGRFASAMADGAREGGLPADRIRCSDTPAAAARLLRRDLRDGVVILVKGSRGARMEEAVRGLEDAE